jgi:two-component system, cell cycle sensor histidine kinase and response regulator CckA
MDIDQTTPREELIRELRSLRERLDTIEKDSARLREAQKLESLGVLAGGFAHEFNNLLMAVLGNADVALANLAPEHPAHRNLQQIGVAARRAADLTGQMLAYAGKGRVMVQELDLNVVIAEMAHLLKISAHNVASPTYHLAAHLPAIEADASQIRQVVVSLIANAAEAIALQTQAAGAASHGSIRVATEARVVDAAFLSRCSVGGGAPGEYVVLEVADTGAGMDEATQARMFDPFYTTKFTGRGLGLAAVQGIIRAHGGAIHVSSTLGAGTTVTVLFPPLEAAQRRTPTVAAAPASLDSTPARPSPAPVRANRRIALLVDDDASVRDVARVMLTQLGFEVHVARDGQEARALFHAHHASLELVLLDLVMPGVRGDAVLAELRQLNATVPVLLMSGYDVEEINQRLEGRGATGFVQKPFTFDELRAAVVLALA